jgi:hypothetical protein
MAFTLIDRPSRDGSKGGFCSVLAAVGLLALVVTGCNTETPLPASTYETDGGASETCQGAETRACGSTLGTHGEVMTCYEGTQQCRAGRWTPCADGTVQNYKSPSAGTGLRQQSLSGATACQANPCDPSCRVYNEEPDGGWSSTTSGTPVYTWSGGTLSQYPTGLVKKGLKEPCQTGSDCQFNHQCTAVSTGLSCAHDKCVTGSSLLSACDSCVAQVCAVDSSCCGDSTCAHDVCTSGVKLDSACNSCAGQVCTAHPECCTTTWTDQCVGYAQTICNTCKCAAGETFNGGHCYSVASSAKKFSNARGDCTGKGLGWDLAEVGSSSENTFVQTLVGSGNEGWIGINDQSDVGNWIWANGNPAPYTNWGKQPDNGHGSDEDCAYLDGLTGMWSDASCSGTRRYMCEGTLGGTAYACATGETLYNGKCYRVRNANNWASAATDCQSLGTGWNLVEIGDTAEDTFLATLTSGGSSYWIGANDQAPSPGEGNWTWSGGSSVSFSNWSGQPDGGSSENCALVAAANGTWSDVDCSVKHYAACEGPVTSSCPSGWTQVGSKCLRASTTTEKWSDAEAACVSQGGHLASVTSAADNSTLLGLTTGNNFYWLGYGDASVEGSWVWSDGAASSYTNWTGEPNGGSSQNCAMVAQADGAWSDEACSVKKVTVCEGPQSTTCPTGWTIMGSRCIKAYTTASTWANAEAVCVAQGGHLASVASAAEASTVLGATADNELYWLGYGDAATEGTFVAKDGSALTYTNWGSQPDGGSTTTCAVVTQSDGKWSDEACGGSKNYVCEGPVTNACPTGWTLSGTKCYQAQNSTATFANAEAACVGLGGHLATIASAGEQTTITTSVVSGTNLYWIGYTDATTEGTWVWKDGASSAYTNWVPSQPDASGTNCATFNKNDGFWYDDACTTSQRYGCEKSDVTGCSGGGLQSNGGHCYKFATNKTFNDAEIACVALGTGWHLVTVNDSAENTFVKNNIGGNGWIGYSNSSSSYAWVSGTSTYTHWYTYPDGASAANCASITPSTGTWDDDDCTTQKRYICQMPVPVCPTGTVGNGGECYQFATTTRTWSQSRTACQALGTGYDLATVSDSTENSYIKGQIAADSWIGYTDTVPGTWGWVSGTSTYTNWRVQPDGGTAQNCVAVDDSSGLWTDESCTTSKRYVCELTPLICATGTSLHDGNCYKFDSTIRTWSNARTSCQAIGTGYDMVTVNDATENAWLVSQVSGDFWSGATDGSPEGTWTWASGTSTYTNWRNGPDGGTGENCATLNDANGLWDDRSCATSFRYVCQTAIPFCATGTSLHNGSCYSFASSTAKYSTAQSSCQSLGTGFDLATVNDAAENTWLAAQLPGDAWVGYTDAAAEGTWAWASGTSAYTNWATEPNGGATENCASLSDSTGKWSDGACTTSQKAICEGPGSVVAAACGSGEISNGGECYYYGTTGKTWSAAETACQARGSSYHLATVSNQAENDFIQTTIGSSRNVWIGYSDTAAEGTFAWAQDDGTTFTSWQSDPNDDPAQECGRLVGADGTWTSEGCGNSKKAVCEGPSSTATGSGGTWTQSCVDKVSTVCDATCNSASSAGVCTPWLPGQKEAHCSTGIDLALGAACAGEQVPVCNHGGIDAPAGVTLAWFPANATQYPKCNPDLAKRKDSGDCVVNVPIPAGKCVTITCPGMSNNAEIMVNPPGASHVAECSCLDNWSLYDKNAACGPPDCSGGVSQASLRKVNMYVIVDRSSSMSSNGKWDGARAALQDFFGDPESAGIGVALEFFPLSAGVSGDASGDGCGMDTGTCSPSRCGNPYVPLGTLTSDAAPTDAQEAALVAPLKQAGWLQFSTPSWPALVGPLDWATARQTSVPNETHIVVFVTDGQPYGSCINGTAQNTNDQLAVEAGKAYANYGVRTYTVGMIGANNAALDKIASSGGTSQAFVIDGTDPAQVSDQLASALKTIAGENVSCDFTLPNQGLFDPSNATVTYTDGAGTSIGLDKQSGVGACGTGWYYDDPANPTTATLCPDSCTAVKQATNARVEIHLGCPAYKGNGVFKQTYEAKCTFDQSPQWGFIGWDATQPANTSIKFKVRTAETLAGLTNAAFIDIASVPTDPAVCPLSGPAPCPKDMYATLGVPAVHHPYLELEVDTIAYQSSAPTVNDFKITYSCTDNQ